MNPLLSRLCMATALTIAAGAATAQTAAASSTTPPAATVDVLPTETIGSNDPTPETPAAARREAYAALAEAQRSCRREDNRDTRRDCLASAQNDFRNLMAQARAPS